MIQLATPVSARRIRLGSVCSIHPGQHITGGDYNSNGQGIGYLTGPADFGPLYPTVTRWTESPKAWAEPGDVLLTVKGAGVGKVNLAPAERVAIGRQLMAIRPDPAQLDQRYLYLWFRRNFQYFQIEALGSTVPGLVRKDVERVWTMLPDLTEQGRIAASVFEQVEDVQHLRRASMAQLQSAARLADAYIREIFNGKEIVDSPRRRLVQCTSKIGSGTTPRGGQSAYVTTGIPLIRSQNVHMNRFFPEGLVYITPAQDAVMAGSRVQAGDVLMNITGASIGRVCLVPDEICPANVSQHVSIIRSNGSIDPGFLSFCLANPDAQRAILGIQAGATRQALTKAQIEQFEVPVPEIPLQRRVVAELMDRLKAVHMLASALQVQTSSIDAFPDALLRETLPGVL